MEWKLQKATYEGCSLSVDSISFSYNDHLSVEPVKNKVLCVFLFLMIFLANPLGECKKGKLKARHIRVETSHFFIAQDFFQFDNKFSKIYMVNTNDLGFKKGFSSRHILAYDNSQLYQKRGGLNNFSIGLFFSNYMNLDDPITTVFFITLSIYMILILQNMRNGALHKRKLREENQEDVEIILERGMVRIVILLTLLLALILIPIILLLQYP